MRLRDVLGWAAGGIILTGCGGTTAPREQQPRAEPTPEPVAATEGLLLAKSGKRLAAEAFRAEDAVNFRHFEDTQLAVACAFGNGADGSVRCFPQPRTQIIYLKADCTEQAAWDYGPAQSRVASAVLDRAEPCPGELPRLAAYRLGEEVYESGRFWGSGGEHVYERVDGVCRVAQPEGKTSPAVARLVALDQELVSARVVSTLVDGGLKVRQVLAEDGAKLNLDVTQSDSSACTLLSSGECVPGPLAAQGGANLDANCETPAYYSPQAAECGQPSYGVDSDNHVWELAKPTHLFDRKLVLPIPANSTDVQFRCEETELFPGVLAPSRDVSGKFPRADLVSLGRGSLSAGAFRVSRGSASFTLGGRGDPNVFELTSGGTCDVVAAGDGTFRCLPNLGNASNSEYFGDASCEGWLYKANGNDVPQRVVEQGSGQKLELHAVKPYTGPIFRLGTIDASGYHCVEAFAEHEPLWVKGDSIDVSTLPLVQSVQL